MSTHFLDEYDAFVSMHHTDAAGVVYIGAPIGWAQIGMENIFRAAGHAVETLHAQNVHYPMVRQDISHAKSLRLGEPIVVRTFVSKVGTRSFTITTQILKADTVHVTIQLTGVAVGRDGTKPAVEPWITDLYDAALEAGLAKKEN